MTKEFKALGFDLPAPGPRWHGAVAELDGVRCGLWLWPGDGPGCLDDLLFDLVADDGDRSRADEVVQGLPPAPHRFRPIHQRKAALRTWLAWQDPPGRPPGVAMQRAGDAGHRLRHDSEAANAFIGWFRQLLQPVE